MKRCIWTILILAMATYTWGANSPSMQRILATSPKVTVDPANTATKARPFVAYTSIDGIKFRIAETDSVLELGGIETTAPDGGRYINPSNSTACPPDAPALSICTLPTGAYWNPEIGLWEKLGVSYDDTTLWAKFAEYMLKSEHDAYAAAVQAQIDAQNTQIGQLKQAMLDYGVTLPGAAPATLAPLDFSTINVSTTKTLTAQIDNTGLGNLVMGTATKSGTGAAKYTLNGGCSGQTIAPGASCVESVTFAPGTVAGTYTAQISFPHNAQGSPTLMDVTGTAQAVQTCSTTPYKDISNITSPLSSPVGSSVYNIYNGIRVEASQTTPHTICKIGARIGSVVEGGVTLTSGSPTGALSGITYRAEIWTTDGTGNLLGMKQSSANVAAGSMVVGSDAVFQFAANVSLTATDAAIITRADHGYSSSNYINLVSGGTNTDGTYSHSVRYRDTLAVASEVTTNEKQFQLYEVQ